MTTDLKAIRSAAEAAPKNMLHVRHDFGAYYSLRHYPGDYYQGRVRGKERANFIATANPATVIALLDRLEAAEKDAARYRWIRDSDWKQSTHPDVWTQVTNDYGELDVAVDAAIGEQK